MRKISIKDFICILLVALQYDLFYLLSTEFKFGQGILLFVSLGVILKYSTTRISFKNPNVVLMLFLFFLLITGAIRSSQMFPQSNTFLGAFLAERILWVGIIFYFAFEKLYNRNMFSYETIKHYLYVCGIIQFVLYFFQWIVSDRVIFLHVVNGIRYGSARFFFQPILLILLYCVALSEFFNNRYKYQNIIYMLLVLGEVLIVQKYRMTLLALFLSTLVAVFLYRGNVRRFFKIFAVGIIALLILLSTQMGQDIIASLQNSGADNSVRGRAAWRLWAFQELCKRPFLGNGYVYTTESFAYGGQLVRQMFSWSFTPGDYGVFGFIYEYGLLGMAWFLTFIITQLKRALYVWKKKKIYTYIVFLIFIIIDS